MPQHWPCCHSGTAKAGTHLRRGLCKSGPAFSPHMQSSALPMSPQHGVGQWGQCLYLSKAAFTLSSVRVHTETETIAGSMMTPLPYLSCCLTGHFLASARWTQSPSTSFWGLEPAKVVSSGLYPTRATFPPQTRAVWIKHVMAGAFWSFSSGRDAPCFGAALSHGAFDPSPWGFLNLLIFQRLFRLLGVGEPD